MMTEEMIFFTAFYQTLLVILLAWCLLHEDKLLRFERRFWRVLKHEIRRALRPLVNRGDRRG